MLGSMENAKGKQTKEVEPGRQYHCIMIYINAFISEMLGLTKFP